MRRITAQPSGRAVDLSPNNPGGSATDRKLPYRKVPCKATALAHGSPNGIVFHDGETSHSVQAQERQIGGKDASTLSYPFMVAIAAARKLVGNGAIIESRWVLTTASALQFTQDALYDVQVGADTFNGAGYWYEILRIYRHPEYIGWDHNIALIKLKGHIKYTDTVQPIDLAVEDKDSLEAIMVSYGFNEDGTSHLREATYTLTADDDCVNFLREDVAKQMIIDQQGYCVFPLPGNTQGQWYNDAGAPLVANEQLHGLFAFAEHEGGANHGSVATRVFKFTTWIQNTIGS
uniref:Peptidase S1 domain-containing protein n=1 Tax=Anopheles culicifacies TaxID=139723 RepID=A0A182ME38_9DIPT